MWVVHQDRIAKTSTAAVLRSRPTFGMYTDVSGSAVYDNAYDYDTFITLIGLNIYVYYIFRITSIYSCNPIYFSKKYKESI